MRIKSAAAIIGVISAFLKTMNFLTPDLLLDLIAAENVGILGVLVWLGLRVLKLERAKPAAQKVNATLKTFDGFAVDAYDLTQDILTSVRTGYGLAKGFVGDIRDVNTDGTTMTEADGLVSKGEKVGKDIKNEIMEIVNRGGDAA